MQQFGKHKLDVKKAINEASQKSSSIDVKKVVTIIEDIAEQWKKDNIWNKLPLTTAPEIADGIS